jgi:hypothetical protein
MKEGPVVYETDPDVTLYGSMGRIGLPPRSFDRKTRMADVKKTLDYWNQGRHWEILA